MGCELKLAYLIWDKFFATRSLLAQLGQITCLTSLYARYNGDLDIWIKPEHANAQKVLAVLQDFGFSEFAIDTSDLSKIGNVIQRKVAR